MCRIVNKFIRISPMILIGAFFVFSSASHAHAGWIDPIYKVLSPDASGNFTGVGQNIAYVWDIMIKFVDSLVLLALIYVAFMNILRIQLDSYAVKKILPTLIMAVILANFSFLISRIIIDLGNISISLFLFGNNEVSGAFDTLIKESPIGPKDFKESNYYSYILGYSFKQIAVIAGAVLMMVLAFIFLIRNYMLYFLVAIAPLGFMAMVLPVTKKFFQQWWSNMFKWTFMPVVSVFWLWLAGQFIQSITGYWLLPVAFAGVCFYMAIKSPFSIDKAIVGGWYGWGKKAQKFGMNQIGGAGLRTSEFGQTMTKKYAKGTWQNDLGNTLNKAGGIINVPSSIEALKKGRDLRYGELKKAGVKTPTYAKLGGKYVRFEAASARHEDELKFSPPEVIAERWGDTEDTAYQLALRANTRQGQMMRQELDSRLGGEGKFMENNTTLEGQMKQRRAIRQLFQDDGEKNILTKFGGVGGMIKDEEAAVVAVGLARRASQDLRNYRTFDEFQKAYDNNERPPLPEPGKGKRRVREDSGTMAVGEEIDDLADAIRSEGIKIDTDQIAAAVAKGVREGMAGGRRPGEFGISGGVMPLMKVELEKISPEARTYLKNTINNAGVHSSKVYDEFAPEVMKLNRTIEELSEQGITSSGASEQLQRIKDAESQNFGRG